MVTYRLGVAVTSILTGVLLAACGATANGPGATPSNSTPALIHTQSIKVGDKTETVLKTSKGLTLYYFKVDTSSTIACINACVKNWPPLIASSDKPTANPALPGTLSVLDGPNGKQVLYNGHPLYTYIKDGDSGDAYGQGIGGKWFAATPDLQAAGNSSASTSQSAPAGY